MKACHHGVRWLVSALLWTQTQRAEHWLSRLAWPKRVFDFMAVRIRLKRTGAKNAPSFRIVVADSRSPRDGKFIEEIGSYDPKQKGTNFKMDLERAKYWVSKGAQPSETVASMIKKASKVVAPA
jgi:small subunit ribosomal protein S16